MFERESGTLEDVLKCLETIKSELKTETGIYQQVHNEVGSVKAEVKMDQRQKKRPYEEDDRSDRFKKG